MRLPRSRRLYGAALVLLAAAVVVLLTYRGGYRPGTPEKVAVVAFLLSAVVYAPLGLYIVDRLYTAPVQRLISLELPEDGAPEHHVYELSEEAWEELEITEAELLPVKTQRGTSYIAAGYDPEDNAARGSWLGALDHFNFFRKKKAFRYLRKKYLELTKQAVLDEAELDARSMSRVSEHMAAYHDKIDDALGFADSPESEEPEESVEPDDDKPLKDTERDLKEKEGNKDGTEQTG